MLEKVITVKNTYLQWGRKGLDIVMKEKTKSFEIDMCHGPLFRKMLKFAVPLMFSSILQLLFNAVDIVVVGRFVGHSALAAVGSTSSLINLLVNVFIGLSIGTNVLTARYFGAGNEDEVHDVVHTSIMVGLVSGAILVVIGVCFSGIFLSWMGTPNDVLDQATLYMRIYFVGMPVMMVYNFCAAVLRAVGDTKRPLYFLFAAGIINAGLNMIFIIVFHMGVEGVAIATVISQCVSAMLILQCLMKEKGACHFSFKDLSINKRIFKRMLQIGLPAGLQGAVFSVSNVLIQSSVNSFGSIAMAGNTAASNLENFVYVSMNAMHQTAVSFTSQNYGGGQYHRIGKILTLCLAMVTTIGIVMGGGCYLLSKPLLHIYSTDLEVIQYGVVRLGFVCLPYFLCGIMDVMVGSLRGLGYSVMPMLVSLTGACGLRVLWIYTIFQRYRTLPTLYVSYPVTWIVTASVHLICYIVVMKKLKVRIGNKKTATE